MKYEYRFVYVGNGKPVVDLLDEGWEPIPNVRPVSAAAGMSHPSTYVFLRREKA